MIGYPPNSTKRLHDSHNACTREENLLRNSRLYTKKKHYLDFWGYVIFSTQRNMNGDVNLVHDINKEQTEKGETFIFHILYKLRSKRILGLLHMQASHFSGPSLFSCTPKYYISLNTDILKLKANLFSICLVPCCANANVISLI